MLHSIESILKWDSSRVYRGIHRTAKISSDKVYFFLMIIWIFGSTIIISEAQTYELGADLTGNNRYSIVEISPLIDGVNSIHAYGIGGTNGVPGPLEGLNSDPVILPFVSAEDNLPKNVAMASYYGSGRVLALGHDGFFINEGIDDADNRQFGENIINWLNHESIKKKVLVTTGHGEPLVGSGSYSSFYGGLCGYNVEIYSGPITDSKLSDVSVLFISLAGTDFSGTEIDDIKNFVSNGGGLFIQGLGWAWEGYSGRPIDEYPMNEVAAPFGIRFLGGYLYHTFFVSQSIPVPDLTISSEDIEIDSSVNIGDFTPIFAVVSNVGAEIAVNVVVQFFDGDPAKGGEKIGSDQIISSINAGERKTCQVDHIITYENDIYVVIDPNNCIRELDENNNIANMGFFLSDFKVAENGWAFTNYPIISKIPFVGWEWGGYCTGMCIYAVYLHRMGDTPEIFSSNCNPNGVKCVAGPSISVSCPNAIAISLLQVSRYSWKENWSNINLDTMNSDYQLIKSNLIQNKPVVLGVGPDNPHNVVAYKIKEFQEQNLIYVYDPNRPGENNVILYLYQQSMEFRGCPVMGGTNLWTKYYCVYPNRSRFPEQDLIDAVIDVTTNTLAGWIFSPADIKIIDPEGLIISKDLQDIPNASYIDGYSDTDHDYSQAIIPNRKVGYYQISVIPKPDAGPTDTYSLKVYSNGTILTLALNTPICEIPDQPYVVEVTENGNIMPHDSPALIIKKTAKIYEGSPPNEVDFSINVTNTGGIPFTSLKVVDILPKGLEYRSIPPIGTLESENVTWNLGLLDPGNSIRINLKARISDTAFGTLTNVVTVTGVPLAGNNVTAFDSESVTVPNDYWNENSIQLGNQIALAWDLDSYGLVGRAKNEIEIQKTQNARSGWTDLYNYEIMNVRNQSAFSSGPGTSSNKIKIVTNQR